MNTTLEYSVTLAQAKEHFEEIKKKVIAIGSDKSFNHSNVQGIIDWGSNLIENFLLAEVSFPPTATGHVCSLIPLSFKSAETRVSRHKPIQYSKCSIEHVSGYRNSDPKEIISELWITLQADPIGTTDIEWRHLARQHCMLDRSRFSFEHPQGERGVAFRDTPTSTAKLFTFDQNRIQSDFMEWVQAVACGCSEFQKIPEIVFAKTALAPLPHF